MENQKHEGWNNYETWVTVLWINTDRSRNHYCHRLVKQVKEGHEDEDEQEDCLALSLKDWIESQNPLADDASIFTDLLNSALSEIDWQEIAENFLSE